MKNIAVIEQVIVKNIDVMEQVIMKNYCCDGTSDNEKLLLGWSKL